MGEMADIFNDMKDRRRKFRAAFGIECQKCKDLQPRRNASILLPGQFCKVDGYQDPRPKLSQEQKRSVNVKRDT